MFAGSYICSNSEYLYPYPGSASAAAVPARRRIAMQEFMVEQESGAELH